MKRIIMVLLTAFGLLQLACYKDKGNYDYHMPVSPTINIDSVYHVFIGDTLIIDPKVTTADPNARYSYLWKISIPKEFRDTIFTGNVLHMVFGLAPDFYNARLTVTDSSNGMKYFQSFMIDGQTQFSAGALVLSVEGNTSQLSFVKPDNTVMPRIYRALHGTDLPGGAQQVLMLVDQHINTLPVLGYWITGTETNDAGVELDASTLLTIKTLRYNFFDPPASAVPGNFDVSADGVLQGVVNGRLYSGSTYTFYGSEVYGMFGVNPDGDYQLYRRVAFNPVMPYALGYDINRKQFVAFTNFGSFAYVGTSYQVTDITAFDPKNTGLDLLHFQQPNGTNCYAFGKSADGTIYEVKFGAAFMGFIQLSPIYKRVFPQPSLITATTKWAGASDEVFYFNSGDKIYRYNPANQDIKPLTTDFGGKTVSMVKLTNNDNTLIAGVDGTVYFLDVSPGKFGDIIQRYDGIPGAPVDVVVRK